MHSDSYYWLHHHSVISFPALYAVHKEFGFASHISMTFDLLMKKLSTYFHLDQLQEVKH